MPKSRIRQGHRYCRLRNIRAAPLRHRHSWRTKTSNHKCLNFLHLIRATNKLCRKRSWRRRTFWWRLIRDRGVKHWKRWKWSRTHTSEALSKCKNVASISPNNITNKMIRWRTRTKLHSCRTYEIWTFSASLSIMPSMIILLKKGSIASKVRQMW